MRLSYFTSALALTVSLAGASLGFGQSNAVTNVSVANYRSIVSPGSITAAWGSNLAQFTTVANASNQGNAVTLPTMLGETRITLNPPGQSALTPQLYFVSPGQINYVVPASSALGAASVSIQSSTGTQQGQLLISNVSPGILTFDGSGNGVPAAQVLRVTSGGQASYESPARSGASTFQPRAIDVSGSDRVYLILFGTGIRNRSANPVIATIAGIRVPVLYAGSQVQYPGLDQINLGPLPQSLAGKGIADLNIAVDGVPANTVQVAIQ